MAWTTSWVQTSQTEPIVVVALDSLKSPVLGLTNLKIFIQRRSDGYYLDWSDNTFKAIGSVVQKEEVLSEADSSDNPGVYELNTASHVSGLDTSIITNFTSYDVLTVKAFQDGAPQSVDNMPQFGELKVGGIVDFIDQAISDNADPNDVLTVLQDLRLHQLVKTNPGAIQPGTGTYIKQLLDEVKARPTHVVLQGFGYDQTNDELTGIIWVESGNSVVSTDLDTCTVRWYDEDGTLLFTMTDSAADSQGIFKLTKSAPGLTADGVYYAVSEIVITGFGTVKGAKANITF